MKYVVIVSLCRSMRVSRLWLRVSSDSSLWKSLCNHSRDYRMCSPAAERAQIAKFTQVKLIIVMIEQSIYV